MIVHVACYRLREPSCSRCCSLCCIRCCSGKGVEERAVDLLPPGGRVRLGRVLERLESRKHLGLQSFRTEFARLKPNLLDHNSASERPAPVVVMTATITAELLGLFKMITGVEFDWEERGDIARRNIAMSLSLSDQPVKPIKSFVAKHRSAGWKVIVYSNHSHRAKHNVLKAAEKVLPDGEGASCLCGETGGVMKEYLTTAWASPIGPLCTLEHINLTALMATSSANCGIDSKFCGAVGREGPPAHLVDWLQEMGRIRPQETKHFYEYLIVLIVATWAKLLLRIAKTENHEERKRQEKSLTVVLRLLVVPAGCIHSALECAFGNPAGLAPVTATAPAVDAGSSPAAVAAAHRMAPRALARAAAAADAAAADAAPAAAAPALCGSMCWHCSPGLTLLQGTNGKNTEVMRALKLHFRIAGYSCSSLVVCAIHAGRADIWPSQRTTKQHANRLVLQLAASGILSYNAKPPAEADAGRDSDSAELNWAAIDRDMAHNDAIRWGFL